MLFASIKVVWYLETEHDAPAEGTGIGDTGQADAGGQQSSSEGAQAGLRALGAALLAPRIGLPGIAYACAFGWCVMLCFEIPYYFYTCKKQQP